MTGRTTGRCVLTCCAPTCACRMNLGPAMMPRGEAAGLPGQPRGRHTVIRVIAAHLNGTAPVSWCGLNFDFAAPFSTAATQRRQALRAWCSVTPAPSSQRDSRISPAPNSPAGRSVRWCRVSPAGVNFFLAKFSGAMVDFAGAKISSGTVGFGYAGYLRRDGQLHRRQVLRGGGPLLPLQVHRRKPRVPPAPAPPADGLLPRHRVLRRDGQLLPRRFSSETVDFTGAEFSGGTVSFSGAEVPRRDGRLHRCPGSPAGRSTSAGFGWTQPPDFGSGFDMSHPPAGVMLPTATALHPIALYRERSW